MDIKIENQIFLKIRDGFEKITDSLTEYTRVLEYVTTSSGTLMDVMNNTNKVVSNYFELIQSNLDEFSSLSNNIETVSGKMENFQGQVDSLKLYMIELFGETSAYISLFADFIPLTNAVLGIVNNINNLSLVTKVATAVQTVYNGVIIWGQRALYIYQMQVLLARSAIATTTGATKAMNIAIAASPYLIAAAAAATLGIAIYKLALGNSETAKAQKRLDEAMTDMNKEVSTEQNSLDTLFGSLYKAKEGTNEWKRAKDKIQEKYGDYLSQLGIEITNVDTARVAYSKLSTAILETARARASERALSSAGDALADKEGQNLTKVRQVLTEEYGEETGNRVFEGIAASIRRGDKEIPERWMQFVRKLNKTVVQSYGTAGQASSYVDNPVTPYI